jgi:MFS family permease
MLIVMDAPWLEVVRERSQFLFLQLWSMHDWYINLQPFACLGFTAIVMPDNRLRKLCAAAALVGAAGLAVALIGGLIGPVAVLVQGQAWRWVWIAVLVSAVLLTPTALQVAREDKCGLFCALLLVLGWVTPGLPGIACVGLATIVWLMRSHIGFHESAYSRWGFAALGIAIAVWIFVECRTTAWPPAVPLVQAPSFVMRTQEMFALKLPAVLSCALIWWALRIARWKWAPLLLSTMIAGFSAVILPAAFKEQRTLASSSDIREFSDWTSAIPPTSTVLVAPSRDVGTFVWFTLGRPNYLAMDQSAGVVFSRATAFEIRRRSDVLLPIMDPDWRILTRLRSSSVSGHRKQAPAPPLTTEILMRICADPQLGFVISPDKAGFDPLTHTHAGAWKDWNLYDCRKVRSALSIT